MVFFIRTSPPDLLNEATKKYDHKILLALENILGKPIGPSEARIASLGIKEGELGIRSSNLHRFAAYPASFASCEELLTQILGHSPYRSCLDNVVNSLNTLLPQNSQVNSFSIPEQRCLSSEIDSSEKEWATLNFLQDKENGVRHLANFLANQ